LSKFFRLLPGAKEMTLGQGVRENPRTRRVLNGGPRGHGTGAPDFLAGLFADPENYARESRKHETTKNTKSLISWFRSFVLS
jgi:hypothetical protein